MASAASAASGSVASAPRPVHPSGINASAAEATVQVKLTTRMIPPRALACELSWLFYPDGEAGRRAQRAGGGEHPRRRGVIHELGAEPGGDRAAVASGVAGDRVVARARQRGPDHGDVGAVEHR